MPSFHLVSHYLCPYVQRAVIVLLEKDIPHERTYIDLADKPDWFLEASPLGRVPLLQTQRANLFESQVIAEYLDEVTTDSIHPKNSLDKARHRSWIDYGSETLAAIGGLYSAQDKPTFEEKRKTLLEKLTRIEKEEKGAYFDGEKFYLVDGVWATIFRYFDVLDQIDSLMDWSQFPKLTIWRTNLSTRASVIAAVPEGYQDNLRQFLIKKESYLSGLLK